MSRARTLADQFNSDGDLALTPVASVNAGQIGGQRNLIINGAMQVAQRGAGPYTQTTSNQYGLDHFDGTGTITSKYTFEQSSVAPAGFVNSTLITSLSAYSVLTGDFFVYRQRVEGLNCSYLGWGTASAKTVTLSFWVRSSLTGNFGGYFTNSGFNRSLPFSYTINSAGTWEHKSVTVLGDTSGTWLTTNSIGIEVGFSLGAGATYSGTANTWAGSFYCQPTGSTSVVGTSGATLYITGVQLEVGDTATPFEYRSYGDELARCQRYYVNATPEGGSTGYIWCSPINLTQYYRRGNYNFPVTMRAIPTAVMSGVAAGGFAAGSPTLESASRNILTIQADASTYDSGYTYITSLTLDAEL